MVIIDYIFIVLATLYGLLNILVGLMQLKHKNIKGWASTLMVLGGIAIIGSTFLLSVILVTFGLIIIHISAINNGFEIHGKLNIKHHLVRLFFSLFLIFLCLV